MTTRTTLTDRYVWSVTRHLSDDTGPDVARELRATIDDAVDAKIGAGLDRDDAERESLSELGDPEVLARDYGGRPAYLIGPGVYPDWFRLMRILPTIVLPVVLIANFATRVLTTDEGWGTIALDTFLLALTVAVHLAFWVTLTFAVIEWTRPESERNRPLTQWHPDQLGEVPDRRVYAVEVLFGAAFSLILAGILIWQFAGVDGRAIQVLNPDLDLTWKAALIGLLVLDALIAVVVWRVGRWTPTLAAVNVVSNAAWATLVVWLLSQGTLFTDLPRVLGERFGWSTDWTLPTTLVALGIILVAVWDGLECILKARRSFRR